jgi:hypothetical protein
VKYLVTVMQAIVVDEPTPEAAQANALAMIDGGFAETVAVEVEPLSRKENEGA